MKKYFILAAAAIAMASCSNDEGTSVANDGTIRITTDLGKAGTRTIDQTVQATQIANGGKVWVAFTTTPTTPDQGKDDDATPGDGKWHTTNKVASAVYTADGNGNLSSAAPTKWPLATPSTETVSIEAWAPFTTAPAIGTGQFTVQADQSTEANYVASDYLYGSRAAFGNSVIASPVLVTFDHKLAKINVNVSNSDGSSVTGAKVVFGPTDLDRDAELKANGAVDADAGGSATGAITMATALDANATASCIIIPQTLAANAELFTITLGSDTYTCRTTAARTFDPTKVYTFNLSLSDGKTIVLSEQINDWTSAGAAESVIANQD